MKKFLLSLGLMATVLGAATFTSCKDDPEPTQSKTATVNSTAALNTLASQLNGQNATVTKEGETIKVVTTDASGQQTTTTYAYVYKVDGETYTTTAALQAALAGKTGVVTVTTALLRNGEEIAKRDTNITISENGTTTGVIVAPTTTSATANIPYTIAPQGTHSGGQAK